MHLQCLATGWNFAALAKTNRRVNFQPGYRNYFGATRHEERLAWFLLRCGTGLNFLLIHFFSRLGTAWLSSQFLSRQTSTSSV
jgi:hypothetical protein